MSANCDPVIDKSSSLGNSCYHYRHFHQQKPGVMHFLRPSPRRINSQTQTDYAGYPDSYASSDYRVCKPANLLPCYGD